MAVSLLRDANHLFQTIKSDIFSVLVHTVLATMSEYRVLVLVQ